MPPRQTSHILKVIKAIAKNTRLEMFLKSIRYTNWEEAIPPGQFPHGHSPV